MDLNLVERFQSLVAAGRSMGGSLTCLRWGFRLSTGQRPISDDRHQCKRPRVVSYPVSYGVSPIAQEADKDEDKGAVCHVVMVH